MRCAFSVSPLLSASKLKISFFAALACVPVFSVGAPAHAQEVKAFEPNDPSISKKNEPKPPALSISFELSPNVTSDLTQARGNRLQDANAASALALNFTTDKDQTFVFSASAGAKWTSDFENGDAQREQSSFLANAKINWNRGFRRISPFVRYDIEHLTNDFFGAQVATDHSFSIGADIVLLGSRRCKPGEVPSENGDGHNACTGSWPYKFTVIPSFDRLESDDPTRERITPRVQGKAEFTLSNGIAFTASGDYQHRVFDKNILGRLTQSRFLGSAGVNFAGLISGKTIKIDKLFLGGQWLSLQTGGPGDISKVSFLPSLAVSFKFGG